jgi:hypothetical protein
MGREQLVERAGALGWTEDLYIGHLVVSAQSSAHVLSRIDDRWADPIAKPAQEMSRGIGVLRRQSEVMKGKRFDQYDCGCGSFRSIRAAGSAEPARSPRAAATLLDAQRPGFMPGRSTRLCVKVAKAVKATAAIATRLQ